MNYTSKYIVDMFKNRISVLAFKQNNDFFILLITENYFQTTFLKPFLSGSNTYENNLTEYNFCNKFYLSTKLNSALLFKSIPISAGPF